MGEHKRNPVAIAAKEGKLPPKDKGKVSKRMLLKLIEAKMSKSCRLQLP